MDSSSEFLTSSDVSMMLLQKDKQQLIIHLPHDGAELEHIHIQPYMPHKD